MIKSKINRAWLAGILDTDGSVYIRKYIDKNGNKYSYCMAMFYNKDKKLLEKIGSIIQGNIHFHYRAGIDKRGIKRGNNYTFTVSRKILKDFLKDILPYLIVRKKRVLKALNDWR